MCCRHTSYLADAFVVVVVLFGGCFATDVYFELGGCFAAIPLGFAAMVVLFGGCFAIISCFVLPHLWHLWRQFILCAGSTLRVVLVRVEVWSVLPMLLAVVRVIIMFSRLYVHFFSVSLLLVLCILVLAKLCLAASKLCL